MPQHITNRPEYTAESYPVTYCKASASPPVRDKREPWICRQAISRPTVRTQGHPSSPITRTKQPHPPLYRNVRPSKDYLLLPYKHGSTGALRRLAFSIKEPDGTVKDIVVFDEADANANTPRQLYWKQAKPPRSTLYIRKAWPPKLRKDWDKGTEHTFQ